MNERTATAGLSTAGSGATTTLSARGGVQGVGDIGRSPGQDDRGLVGGGEGVANKRCQCEFHRQRRQGLRAYRECGSEVYDTSVLTLVDKRITELVSVTAEMRGLLEVAMTTVLVLVAIAALLLVQVASLLLSF